LQQLVRHAEERMRKLGLPVSGSQIQPVIVGSDRRAMELAEALQARGHDVRAIRPPTVPEGTARLRLALTLHITQDDLDALFDDLGAVLR
jgi:8-amino-7-oxononanoate synthase